MHIQPLVSQSSLLKPKQPSSAFKCRFGVYPPYQGPFNTVTILTDYGNGKADETSNAEIEDRFLKVLAFVGENRGKFAGFSESAWTKTPQPKGVLHLKSISDLPSGHIDSGALSLLRLGVEHGKNSVIIHVVDPGVGVTDGNHDRSILVSKNHGIYVGPNNGTLGLLYKRLLQEGDKPDLLQIDLNKVTGLERLRFKNSHYQLPVLFHGRDVFAVVAAAITGGVDPYSLATKEPNGQIKHLEPVLTRFSQESPALPGKPGEVVALWGLKDKTFDNVKLNTPYSHQLKIGDRFEVFNPKTNRWLKVPVAEKFNDVAKGELLLYRGISKGIIPQTDWLELAANQASAGEAFGIPSDQSRPLLIRKPIES